jgi:D-alanyl-D-alanine carboxypeptidase (penicillin-binding protein 5/6)
MPLGVAADLYVTVPRGKVQHLQSAIQFGARLIAPIRAGQQLGELSVTLDGQTIAQRPVTALQPVAAAGLLGRTVDSIKLMFEE